MTSIERWTTAGDPAAGKAAHGFVIHGGVSALQKRPQPRLPLVARPALGDPSRRVRPVGSLEDQPLRVARRARAC